MRNKGFTLLDLLIVIILIGLLASIGIVQYAKAVGNSKNAAAKATLGEMRKVALGYESKEASWPSWASDTTQYVNLDNEGGNELVWDARSTKDFTFTANAGTGYANKLTGAGGGVNSWKIDFSTGSLVSY